MTVNIKNQAGGYMRKVHEKAIENLTAGKQGRVARNDVITCTMADFGGLYKAWYYHENPIATIDSTGVHVNWNGYYTYSTNMRIYALCAYLGVPRPEKKEGWIKVA